MTAEPTEAEVLEIAAAQADARRAANDERAAGMEFTPLSELLRERLGAQVARSAERRGRLNVGGAA
jgi:hypothetical protein